MIDYYDNNDYISQSRLKKLFISPAEFVNYSSAKETVEMMKGSAVDCLLTTPDKFSEWFAIDNDFKRPTSKMKQYCDAIIEGKTEEEAYKIADYSISLDRVIANAKEFEDYIYLYQNREDKIILNKQEYELSLLAFSTIETSEEWTEIMEHDCDFQVPIYWEYKGVPMKSLLDVVAHNDNYVIPIDIKTTYNVYSFDFSFAKYRYDIQAVSYSLALQQLYPDKEIKPFRFLTVDYSCPSPLVYELGKEDYLVGLEGNEKYKGFNWLIDAYKYYSTHGFIHPYGYIENGRKIKTDFLCHREDTH